MTECSGAVVAIPAKIDVQEMNSKFHKGKKCLKLVFVSSRATECKGSLNLLLSVKTEFWFPVKTSEMKAEALGPGNNQKEAEYCDRAGEQLRWQTCTHV